MTRIDIPRENWAAFCREFADQHRGWLFTVSECDPKQFGTGPEDAEQYARRLADMMPLESMAFEEDRQRSELSIKGRGEAEDIVHLVHQPQRIEFEKTGGGGHRGLNVHTATDRIVLMRFRAASIPETLDGLAETELSCSRSESET